MFALEQALERYDLFTRQIERAEARIDDVMEMIAGGVDVSMVELLAKPFDRLAFPENLPGSTGWIAEPRRVCSDPPTCGDEYRTDRVLAKADRSICYRQTKAAC